LGRFGGDLALTTGALGGVYIAGGIVPRFFNTFLESTFREKFEDKGRFTDYVKEIPVFLITYPYAGLLGAGSYVRQKNGKVL
jgi:glucokinase